MNFLNEQNSKLSNQQRLRALTLIQSIALGCFRLVPRIPSEPVHSGITSVVPADSKYQVQYSIHFKELSIQMKDFHLRRGKSFFVFRIERQSPNASSRRYWQITR